MILRALLNGIEPANQHVLIYLDGLQVNDTIEVNDMEGQAPGYVIKYKLDAVGRLQTTDNGEKLTETLHGWVKIAWDAGASAAVKAAYAGRIPTPVKVNPPRV